MEKEIVTGCAISVILFVMGMNLIIKASEREAKGPKTESGIRMPTTRGYMDDLTITVEKPVQARWVLTDLDREATSTRMCFKPKKSRRLTLVKSKNSGNLTFNVQGERIPPISESPITCLGKWYDNTLKDKQNITGFQQWVKEMARKIGKTSLPGKIKA